MATFSAPRSAMACEIDLKTIPVTRGGSWQIELSMTDDAGVVDLTGRTIDATFTPDDGEPFAGTGILTDAPNGEFTVSLDSTQTALLALGAFNTVSIAAVGAPDPTTGIADRIQLPELIVEGCK